MDFLRSPRERAKTPPVKEPVKEPEPLEVIEDVWTPAAQMATVGIFVMLLVAALYLSRPVLLPVVAAMIIGTTLAPIVKAAARRRVSPWVTAIALGIVLIVIAAVAVTLLAAPVSEWIGKAPEIGAASCRRCFCRHREGRSRSSRRNWAWLLR